MKHQKHHVWTKVKEALKELYQDMPINLHKPWYNEAEIILRSVCINKKNNIPKTMHWNVNKNTDQTNKNDDTNTQHIACLTIAHWQKLALVHMSSWWWMAQVDHMHVCSFHPTKPQQQRQSYWEDVWNSMHVQHMTVHQCTSTNKRWCVRTNGNATMIQTRQTWTNTFNRQWIMTHQKHDVWAKVKEALNEFVWSRQVE